MENIAIPIPAVIDEATISAALTRLATESVDAYDMFLLEAAAKAGIIQILTDDGDFVTVSGIQVFTANQNVIESARIQGKLLSR